MDTKDTIRTDAMLKELEELLSNHDQYYVYSDDHRVWTKGNEESKVIGKLTAELTYALGQSKAVNKLYNKYLKQ